MITELNVSNLPLATVPTWSIQQSSFWQQGPSGQVSGTRLDGQVSGAVASIRSLNFTAPWLLFKERNLTVTTPLLIRGLLLGGKDDCPHCADSPGNFSDEFWFSGVSSRIVSLLSTQPSFREVTITVTLTFAPWSALISQLQSSQVDVKEFG